ncbi:MAG: preprotein translocase subunit SecG [Candidatus Nomurabacteria bacterium]
MNWLSITIVITSILLIVLVLMQKSNTDGAGLGGDSLGITTRKRGLEKLLFQTTIVVAIIFVAINFIAFFVK